MLLIDVNVLVYASGQRSPEEEHYAQWLKELMDGEVAYGIADLVLSGFLRIVTHPGIFSPPVSIAEALAFAEQVRGRPQCVSISPRPLVSYISRIFKYYMFV